VLTALSSLAVTLNRDLIRRLLPWTVPGARRRRDLLRLPPGLRLESVPAAGAPLDGAGLNPSLQNPYMMIHPPLLYLGYVGLTIPFAFAMGALLSGRFDEAGSSPPAAGRCSPGPRSESGSCSGAKWAYEEVGWGGYYAWDPVENAALMPWLAVDRPSSTR
jgi:cytochrome c-type biogenesis protein CcmF